jgi:hypothetical protein
MTDESQNSRPKKRHPLLGNNMVTKNYAITEELLEAMFPMQFVPRLYWETQLEFSVSTRVEVGLKTSTIALLVVGDKIKGTVCLWV